MIETSRDVLTIKIIIMKTKFFKAFQVAVTSLFVVGLLLVVYGILTQGCDSASFGIYN